MEWNGDNPSVQLHYDVRTNNLLNYRTEELCGIAFSSGGHMPSHRTIGSGGAGVPGCETQVETLPLFLLMIHIACAHFIHSPLPH